MPELSVQKLHLDRMLGTLGLPDHCGTPREQVNTRTGLMISTTAVSENRARPAARVGSHVRPVPYDSLPCTLTPSFHRPLQPRSGRRCDRHLTT